MGLVAPVAELLAFEATYRPLSGDVAVLGTQTVYMTRRSLDWLLAKYNIPRREGLTIDLDTSTFSPATAFTGLDGAPMRFISDRSFLQSLGADTYSSIDVSDYEGADIIWDMSLPVPKELHSRLDFIYDGSSLDNIFNPAQALVNMSCMLRPGGRLVCVEHCSMVPGAYTTFSPGWFFDFFAANKYRDCKVYAGMFEGHRHMFFGPWPVFAYNWFGDKLGQLPQVDRALNVVLYVIAEKGDDSTDTVIPVQHGYRDPGYNDSVFTPNVQAMFNSPRPAFGVDTGGRPPEECPGFLRAANLCDNAPF